MSLRAIHMVFIVSSIAMAAVVATWSVGMYSSGRGSIGQAVFAVGSLLAAAVMAVYLVKFARKTRDIGME
tara:strand:+ start:234 stop:443 length:210 start_codon:yes stop_codon:yes gene_type:complete